MASPTTVPTPKSPGLGISRLVKWRVKERYLFIEGDKGAALPSLWARKSQPSNEDRDQYVSFDVPPPPDGESDIWEVYLNRDRSRAWLVQANAPLDRHSTKEEPRPERAGWINLQTTRLQILRRSGAIHKGYFKKEEYAGEEQDQGSAKRDEGATGELALVGGDLDGTASINEH